MNDLPVRTVRKHPLFLGTEEQLVRKIFHYVDRYHSSRDDPVVISAINAERYCLAHRNPSLASLQSRADLVTVDGKSIQWLSQLWEKSAEERVCTTDLIHRIVNRSEGRKPSYYLLGSTEEEVERAASNLSDRYPELPIAGYHHGYFEKTENQQVIESINGANPDILWVGMGFPKEQQWVLEHKQALEVPVTITCGGLFNFLSEKNDRAPEWMQKMGMEWLFRIGQEPVRLGPRYLKTIPFFVLCGFQEVFRSLGSSLQGEAKVG